MKTHTKKLILVITAGALLLGAIGGGLGAILHQSNAVETFAYFTPTSHYTNGDAATYYSSVTDSLSGTELLSKLRSINGTRRKKTMGYSAGGTSATSSTFIYTDYDTSNPSTLKKDSNGQTYGTVISSFYSYTPTTAFNKEHVWPKTHGGNKVEADIHMARPTIQEENGNRGHSYYVEGMNSNNNTGWDPYKAGYNKNSKGEAARIIFYCMVATDQLVLEAGSTNSSKTSNNKMGDLESLLKWNLEIPVTDRERNRNEGAEYLQGNRNPFIDHPEYACKIWGNTNSNTKKICGDTPVEKTVTSISISGTLAKKDYYVGDTFNSSGLTITAWYSDGTSANVTNSSNLSYSPTKFTSVNANQLVTFSYTEDGKTVSASVTVNVKESTVHVTSVSLNEIGIGLTVGETQKLIATVLPQTATNKSVEFSSSDTNVARVSADGTVTAVGKGTAVITARSVSDPSAYALCDVTVTQREIPVTRVSFASDSLSLTVGQFRTVSVSIQPSDATNKDLEYLSSDPDVASVSNNGLITANKAGIAVISVFASSLDVNGNRVSDSIEVTVSDPIVGVEGVSLNVHEIEVVEGDSRNLIATILPSNATNKNVTWDSDDETIATVNDGEVEGLQVGTTTITVSTEDGHYQDSCEITVIPEEQEIPLTAITVSKTSVTLDAGGASETISVSFTPSNATNIDLIWTSLDDSIATVDNGVITGIRKGATTITVTSAANEEITASIEVVVNGEEFEPVNGILLDVVNATISVDKSLQINATITPENVYDDGIIWSTSDPTIARVSNGKVIPVGVGEVQITATSHENPEIKATATIIVVAAEEYISVQRIGLDYSTKELTEGDNFTLKATVYPENATNKKVNWTVTDSSIISVDANGKVTALKAGTASVFASSDESSFIRSVCQITVKEKSDVPVEATLVELVIGRLPNKTTYLVGETFVKDGLVINGHFSDGTVHDVTELCSFNIPSTAQEGISTVHAIYAQSGVSVSFDIVVSNKTLTGIQITKSPTKLEYFAGESLLNYGIEVVATYDDESTINVTDIVSYDIETFDTTGIIDVVVSYQEFTARFSVLVKEGTATSQTKANDFALVFNYKTVDIDNNEISAQKWAMLKFYYSKLDEGSKEVLKNATYSKTGKTEVRAADPDQIEECVRDYDAMYLAHKGQDGFDDFMNRNPQPEARDNTSKIDPKIIFGIAIGAIVLIPLIIVIAVVASRKRKAKYDK